MGELLFWSCLALLLRLIIARGIAGNQNLLWLFGSKEHARSSFEYSGFAEPLGGHLR